MDGPLFFTIKEAAEELQKSDSALLRWLEANPCDRSGRPFYLLAGRMKLFRREDIDRMRSEMASLERTPTFIYFVAVSGHVKIGRADDWQKRLSVIQTASPFAVECLLVLEAFVGLERQLHEKFAAFRIRGEWFKDCPEIRAFIARAGRHRVAIELNDRPGGSGSNVIRLRPEMGKGG